MKEYETIGTSQRLMKFLPICVRIDGKSFHSWTSNLNKPFDQRLYSCFHETAITLINQFKPVVVYNQSDEISLIMYYPNEETELPFGGKMFKLISIAGSVATAAFNDFWQLNYSDVQKRLAYFDCRVWQVPNLDEVVNYLLWREQDAVRNSIQSTGQFYFSHKQLQGKNNNEVQEMLFQLKNVNWNNYPKHFKMGLYLDTGGNEIDIQHTDDFQIRKQKIFRLWQNNKPHDCL